jgi:SNF2 family DNA or RNA helicase
MEQIFALGKSDSRCSMCREPLKRGDAMLMNTAKLYATTDRSKDLADKPEEQLEYSKYGTKLAAFINFMKSTLKEKPNAKFILFIQFKRLMCLVSEALKSMGITHVTCTGNVATRTKSVREFKYSEATRLILLSSEDSVSGLHLVEATHMVIFHPFLINGNDDLAVSYEKQGIARAWRGGLDHPVELIRFIVRDSIEEDLAKKRAYQEGTITHLDEVFTPGSD